MDEAYNQHSPYGKRHVRSHTNLNHLSLAPLTSRLPLLDPDALPEPIHRTSYLEGRSAPTTPSILSRSSSRVAARKSMDLSLPKSKSSTQLPAAGRQPRCGLITPSGLRSRRLVTKDDLASLSAKDRNDSDWLLRAGAVIASSARESKGQSWLVSRASSTSLTGQRDEEEEELERELARERERSRRGSAIGAFDADDEFSPVTTRRSLSFDPNGTGSRPASRYGSRGHSRRGSRAHLLIPMGLDGESYFDQAEFPHEEFVAEPDFVDVEEEVGINEDEVRQDEAIVRKLARASSLGLGGWVEKMLGWTLFAVDEDGEDAEIDTSDEKGDDSEISTKSSTRTLDGNTDTPAGGVPPPLRDGEAGGWNDAAWLLSVASKVLL